jgi:hypothetical protein
VLLTAGRAISLKAGKCMSPRTFLGTHPRDEPISSRSSPARKGRKLSSTRPNECLHFSRRLYFCKTSRTDHAAGPRRYDR